jgi:hypothetical protein
MKQTAVEWLVDEYFGGIENCTPDFRFHIQQALAMEKEQKKCYHPLSERKYTSDTHFECTICGGNNY